MNIKSENSLNCKKNFILTFVCSLCPVKFQPAWCSCWLPAAVRQICGFAYCYTNQINTTTIIIIITKLQISFTKYNN